LVDSLHLAMAECVSVDILLSTDDKFISATRQSDSKVPVMNPVDWLMGVLENEG
jgi:hypothetical protein